MLLKMPYQIETANLKYKILIYGQPGIGKSTLALSMPSPVLIDADNGVHRIDPKHRVPTLQVTSYREVLQLLDSGELAPFETLVIDTAGKLLDYINAYIIEQNPKNGRGGGQLSMQGWGARASTFASLLRKIGTMNKHVIFVAHEKETSDGDTRYIRPDFGGGKSGNELIKDLDLVGYMEALGRERTISFSPSDKYYAKNSARITDVLNVPQLAAGVKNNFMAEILAKCVAASQDEGEERKQYDDVIGAIEASVNAIADADTATACIGEIKALPVVWDSKQRAQVLFAAKVKSLGLIYDKAAQKYIDPARDEQEAQSA